MTRYFPLFFLVSYGVLVNASDSIPEETQPVDNTVKAKTQRTKATPAISERVYKKLSEIQTQIQSDDKNPHAKISIEKINKAFSLADDLEKAKLTPYELTQVQNIKAFLYYLKDDVDSAIATYQKIINSPDTPEGLYLSSLRTVTQLYMVKEQYQKVIASANKVIENTGRDADMLALIAIAYYQLQNNQKAFVHIKEAVDQYINNNRKPKEQWLVLLRFLYIENKDEKNAIEILKILVKFYPRPSYLLNLASAFGLDGKDSKQLALMELLYDTKNLNNEGEYRNLTGLMLNLGISFKASRILSTLIENKIMEESEQNLLLLSQAYFQSHNIQKSIQPLLKAANKSNSSDLHLRLAYSYSGLEKWQDVVSACEKAISLNNFKSKDNEKAIILLGTAYFNLEQYKKSLSQFMKIKDSKTNDKIARDWIQYVSATIDREAVLERIKNEESVAGGLDALQELKSVITN